MERNQKPELNLCRAEVKGEIMGYKACSRCGKIHDTNFKCTHNKPKWDYERYGTAEERKLRNTSAWIKKSQEIREQAQYLCEVCRDKGIYNYNDLEVHHITKIREDSTKLLEDTNLICLCIPHHKQADKGQLDKEYLTKLAKERISKYGK